MNSIIKNILAIIVGITIGMIVNMGLIIIGSKIFPYPSEAFFLDATSWDIKYFIFPFLAHAIGTLAGAFTSLKISKKIINPIIVGIYFLSGGIYMVLILPSPIWFICLDLIIAYIPMALLGWKLNNL